MRFKGTIVITDPCYLDQGMDQNLWEISDYGSDLTIFGCSQWICKDTIYGDWSCFTYKGTKEEISTLINKWDKLYAIFWSKYNTPGITEEQKNQFFIEYKNKKQSFIKDHTLGEFCADAGMVCVVYLDEISKVNPTFKEWAKTHPWCVTIIDDFDGDIEYEVDDNDEAHIVGVGNINFYTSQSGF